MSDIKPVREASPSDQVFTQLRRKILTQEYRAGDLLPSEHQLCELFKADLSSVHEALKRLERWQLIEIRHGEESTVLDFRYHAGFEMLPHLVAATFGENPIALRSIIEFRSLITPEIARLAALRIAEKELSALGELVDKLEAVGCEDTRELQALDFEFHYIMAIASENLALLLILNSVRDAYMKFRDFYAPMFSQHATSKGTYRIILEALRAHDPERARRICAEQLNERNRLFWAACGSLLQPGE